MEETKVQKSIDFSKPIEVGYYFFRGFAIAITEVKDNTLSATIVDKEHQLSTYSSITLDEFKKIINYIDDHPTQEDKSGEVRHKSFGEIKQMLDMQLPVYLYGPAGSGKNVLCKQLADELGLNFYYTNCVLTKFDLVGYGDANGNYVSTAFYKAFTEGGLFMLDEFDASAEEAAITLNAALANGYFDFPVVGNVEAHPNFRVIACGNTCGRGADEEYTGRSCLDAATLDRFGAIWIDYDERIERKIARSEIVDFIHDLRQSRDRAGIKMILGYRAISRIAKLETCFPLQRTLEIGVLKGMDKDEAHILWRHLKDQSNEFATALYQLANK